jgi:hypothetical protein
MNGTLESLREARTRDHRQPRLLGIFAAWRLEAYGYGIAVVYLTVFVHFYWAGAWIVDRAGVPVYTDFACAWAATVQALHGAAVSLYDPTEFVKIQMTLLGMNDPLYPNWPYPPTFFFFFAPFASLPYFWGFIAWDVTTLAGCLVVTYFIVRRRAAMALVLASPFTAWNLLAGQNGFLTASLLGAALLFLERWPVLAGVFIGCLSYKPQFAFLIPLALFASKRWRAFASAAMTAAVLAGASMAAFGTAVWEIFPHGLIGQADLILLAGGQYDPAADWGRIQTVYGLMRDLGGSAMLAAFAQSLTTVGAGIGVWMVWRSTARYALQAAVLSAAALIATPYAFTYDMAAIAIPMAFLAKDQISCGLLRGEQTILIALFGACLAALVVFGDSPYRTTFGSVPLGPVVVITLLGLTLRRAFRDAPEPAIFAYG